MDTATQSAADDATQRWARADLVRFPDDGHRRELVDGQLLVSPLARRRHRRVVARICFALESWSRAGAGGAVYPGVNVDLAADTHLEPDVAWSQDTDESGPDFERTPELVVEVGSPSTHRYDRGIKRGRYLASGAREVWLVDLGRDEVEVHRTTAADPTVLHRGDTLTSTVLRGFAAAVDDLLGPP